VLDLLAQAGGPVGMVAGEQATLIHQDGSKVTIDLHALFEGDPTQNPVVTSGDTIYVPRAPQFYVYGEVQRPGFYRLERNMTVTQAISAGGGLTPKGSEHGLKVKRRDASGKEQEVSVKGPDLLQPDDVLSIRESWF
jgi:polysaccharide export outer membrane protein